MDIGERTSYKVNGKCTQWVRLAPTPPFKHQLFPRFFEAQSLTGLLQPVVRWAPANSCFFTLSQLLKSVCGQSQLHRLMIMYCCSLSLHLLPRMCTRTICKLNVRGLEMRYKDMSPSLGKSGNCYSDLGGEMLGFFLMLKEKERIVNTTITFTGHVKMTVHWNPQHTSSYESAGVNSAQIIYTLGVGCRDQEGS